MTKDNLLPRIEAIEKTIMAGKKALTVDEACNYLGMKKSYLYKLTSAGILPFSKPNGKRIYFNRDALDQWLLSNPSKTNAQLEEKASTYVATH